MASSSRSAADLAGLKTWLAKRRRILDERKKIATLRSWAAERTVSAN